MRTRLVLWTVAGLIVAGNAWATKVTRLAFGTGTVVENFEGIVAPGPSGNYPNMEIHTPFVFPSGIRMDLPSPSVSGTFGPYVVEFKGGGGFFGMGQANLSMIPSGTAYLGQANPGLFTGDIRFILPSPATRVGAYFATATDSDTGAVTFEAYNHLNQLVESQVISNVHFKNWKNTFVGLEAPDIEYVMFRGNHASALRVDDFMFTLVPAPTAAISGTLLVLGVVLTRARASRRRGLKAQVRG